MTFKESGNESNSTEQKYDENAVLRMDPILKARANGGVLAVSPEGARLRIGVTADTKEDAVEMFRAAARRWAYDLRNLYRN